MKKVFFTENAENDIKQIFQFNSALNKSFAKRVNRQILEEIKILANYPESAPVEHLLDYKTETFRSLVVADGRYKVIYTVKEEQVIVYIVFDCRRNPEYMKLDT